MDAGVRPFKLDLAEIPVFALRIQRETFRNILMIGGENGEAACVTCTRSDGVPRSGAAAFAVGVAVLADVELVKVLGHGTLRHTVWTVPSVHAFLAPAGTLQAISISLEITLPPTLSEQNEIDSPFHHSLNTEIDPSLTPLV